MKKSAFYVGAYHIPTVSLQGKDYDIGFLCQGVFACMCVPLNCLANIIISNVVCACVSVI